MRWELSEEQIAEYRKNGFIIIEHFLDAAELAEWSEAIDEAVARRGTQKLHEKREGWDVGAPGYYENVFVQRINLWRDNPRVRKLMLDWRIGRMVADLEGIDGVRIWHDQALYKPPWGNQTSFHLDTPYWSFRSLHATSIWIALDDVTAQNGCMVFLPGTHRKGSFDNVGIGNNMGEIFQVHPEFASIEPVVAEMPAGSCTFHNGLTVHGAGANLTPRPRRAMTCGFMPDGATFCGVQNILSNEQVARLKIGDLLNDNDQNPLIYSRSACVAAAD